MDVVDKVVVQWPRGKVTVLNSVKTNQTLYLNERDGVYENQPVPHEVLNKTIFRISDYVFPYVHHENTFSDFDRDRLLFHMTSNEGPKGCVGDVNGDGLQDVFIGGARGYAGSLLIQQRNGSFATLKTTLFEEDKEAEDAGCLFLDADNDGDQDLYVCSGGNELPNTAAALIDRLYINDGKGNFRKSSQTLPTPRFESTSVVRAVDFDKDGDLDLFVGCRMQPATYGPPANGIVLFNDGKGNFTDVTDAVAPQLKWLGMITDAVWADVNNDGNYDLIVAGEWMKIKLFLNENSRLVDASEKYGLQGTSGWWNCIRVADLNGDGLPDIVAGNHGLNSRFKASAEQPVEIFINDFDNNGTLEHIITVYNNDKAYPMVLRHDLVSQMPLLEKEIPQVPELPRPADNRHLYKRAAGQGVASVGYGASVHGFPEFSGRLFQGCAAAGRKPVL